MFVTLEDETGNLKVVVRPSLLEKQRRKALGAALLAVYGTWQCHSEVRQLVAQRLVDMSHLWRTNRGQQKPLLRQRTDR
jgi:error-prone DNA polymerase